MRTAFIYCGCVVAYEALVVAIMILDGLRKISLPDWLIITMILSCAVLLFFLGQVGSGQRRDR